MLGAKMNKKHLVNGFNKAKNFIGSAYNNTKRFLGNVDHGVRLFKTVYGALQPALEHYGGGNHINNNVMKVLNGYDNIRNKAMEAEGHLDNVKHTLAKKQVKFNFA